MAHGKLDVLALAEQLIGSEEAALTRLQVTPQEIAMFEAGAALRGPREIRAFVAWHRCAALKDLRKLLAANASAAGMISTPALPSPLRRDPHAEPDKTEPSAMIVEFIADEPSGC